MKNALHFIRLFALKYSTRTDWLFVALVLITLFLGIFFSVLNSCCFHYPTILLFANTVPSFGWLEAVILISLCSIFYCYGLYIKNESPRSATFLWGLGLFAFAGISNIVIVNGIQSTPFPPIDDFLATIDRAMGIHSAALMAWTHAHPHLHHALNWIYNSMLLELIFIPLALTCLNGRHALTVFYLSFLITAIIGCLIYYFFPTMAPSGIIHSPYFLKAQDHTSLRFRDIHDFIRPTVSDGGLIAFPSFHVIWAVLLTNACRSKKIIFYPLMIYNVVLIISTVLLGWHYLIDVIGGIVLAVLTIEAVEGDLRLQRSV